MKIKKNFFLKHKILLKKHNFNNKFNNYKYFLNHFNSDILTIVDSFLYPSKKNIIKWKRHHISKSYLYISLFKYLIKNNNTFKQKNTENAIYFLKKKYNHLNMVRDLYYLQFKIYQKNININDFHFQNNSVKYHSK